MALTTSPIVSAQDVELEVSKDFAASGRTLETGEKKFAKENDDLREQDSGTLRKMSADLLPSVSSLNV